MTAMAWKQWWLREIRVREPFIGKGMEEKNGGEIGRHGSVEFIAKKQATPFHDSFENCSRKIAPETHLPGSFTIQVLTHMMYIHTYTQTHKGIHSNVHT